MGRIIQPQGEDRAATVGLASVKSLPALRSSVVERRRAAPLEEPYIDPRLAWAVTG